MDVLFVNPRDLSVPAPYVRSAGLAAVLRENGFSCSIIEPCAEDISINEIVQRVQKQSIQLICLSVFPSTLPDAYQTIRALRKSCVNITIVVEGYMVNADANSVIQLNADYGLSGDGEYALLGLCEQLFKNQPKTNVDGLIVNRSGELETVTNGFVRNLNELPPPAFDLLPIGKYYSASTNKVYMILFTDRGCPYACSFCANASQKRYRYLSTENVISQLKTVIIDLKVEWLEFMDLTFTLNKRRTIEICKGIIDAQLNFDWACETRADLLDDELLGYMSRAGCKKITIGVESGNEAIRDTTGKNISDKEFIEKFALCKKHGIKTMANFIIGHPNETVKTALETINFSIKLDSFNVLFTKMTPLPDVEIYFNGVKNKEVEKDVWYKYMRGEQSFPVYYPKTIGKWKMELLYRYAFVRFYCRPKAMLKYASLFKNPVFAYSSIKVFLRFVFGKTLYK